MSETREQPEWLTVQQAADRWRVSYDLMLRQVKAKKVPSLVIGSLHRIPLDWVMACEAKAKEIEDKAGVRHAKRAYARAGKDHYPDC